MEKRIDFVQWLQIDVVLTILKSLDDPSDLIRVCAVSHFWRHFVITNGLCKQLCLRLFPQLSCVAYVPEPSCGTKRSVEVGSSNSLEWQALEKEHRAYAFLARALTTFTISDYCISKEVGASSTDNYPVESIHNTLIQGDRFGGRASYWSSKGQSNPAVPETLYYQLTAKLSVITEICVQPFQAYFQPGHPIYSAKSVRFRMGHPISPKDLERDLSRKMPLEIPADDKFVWTYTSQEFPMAQENSLQRFRLPEPVLCIGGFLQVELLGRVQRQEIDRLFYICVAHVKVVGRSLFPAFDLEIGENSGNFLLKYYPKFQNSSPPVNPNPQLRMTSNLLAMHLGLEEDLFAVHGNALDFEADNWNEEDDDDDDDDNEELDLVIM